MSFPIRSNFCSKGAVVPLVPAACPCVPLVACWSSSSAASSWWPSRTRPATSRPSARPPHLSRLWTRPTGGRVPWLPLPALATLKAPRTGSFAPFGLSLNAQALAAARPKLSHVTPTPSDGGGSSLGPPSWPPRSPRWVGVLASPKRALPLVTSGPRGRHGHRASRSPSPSSAEPSCSSCRRGGISYTTASLWPAASCTPLQPMRQLPMARKTPTCTTSSSICDFSSQP